MRHKKSAKMVMAAIAAVMLMTACGKEVSKDTQKTENTQSTAEAAGSETEGKTTDKTASKSLFGEFQGETLQGDAVSQDIFAKAEVTMVNVWGINCIYCIKEMPELAEISKEYADKGVQIVGIISDVSEPKDATALEIVDKTGADYTHIVLKESLRKSLTGKVTGTPTTFFLDKEGNQIGQAYAGARDKAAWTEILDSII